MPAPSLTSKTGLFFFFLGKVEIRIRKSKGCLSFKVLTLFLGGRSWKTFHGRSKLEGHGCFLEIGGC